MSPHCGSSSIQIGVHPLVVWGVGIILWLLFLAQALLLDRRGPCRNLSETGKDLSSCCARQRSFSLFACEASIAWFDFVSDLCVALSVCFPNVALFVLMWVFIGVQLFPYMFLVLRIRSPGGFVLLPPPDPLLDWRNVYAGCLLLTAFTVTLQMATACWQCFRVLFLGHGPLAAACACCFLGPLLGACGLSVTVAFWALVSVAAAFMGLLWLSAWVLLISLWVVLRIILLAFGFLLYVTKTLPFPDVPITQLFFVLWTGKSAASAFAQRSESISSCPPSPMKGATYYQRELDTFLADGMGHRRLSRIPSSDSLEAANSRGCQGLCCPCCTGRDDLEPSIHELSYQGVNIFMLHFSYIFELMLESVAQVVIQILLASLGSGGWTLTVIVSVIISVVLIVVYGSRYAYWLVYLTCKDGKPIREQLTRMHLHYYGMSEEQLVEISTPDLFAVSTMLDDLIESPMFTPGRLHRQTSPTSGSPSNTFFPWPQE